MEKLIEDLIIEGKAVALKPGQVLPELMHRAQIAGIRIYAPLETGELELTWASAEAKKANRRTLKRLSE